ncbi:MAG TPA: Gfo/Idh/MocA family oxidoreductase [Roseiflexaceae bacterium]|nr:Gfo/Idh/MocA family oxidoreductase [Roseiflexaceae bacterium]
MTLRWGILSTARIARAFAAPLLASGVAEVLAVASRDAERAGAFARDLGIPHSYGSYAELLADPQIDAVYIGLPNSLHAEWTIAAVRAGKHVLCEKPLGVGRAEAAGMYAAADAAGVTLMEAFMYRFHPRTLAVQDLLRQGAIGELRLIRASFGFTVSDPANIRLSAELAGGALMDVGCYCVNFARMAAGQRPARVSATARWADSGVDDTLAATLEFPGGVLAQIACSLSSSQHHTAQLIGSEGAIEIDDAFVPSPDRPSSLRVRRGTRNPAVETIEFPPVNQYQREAEAFAQLLEDPYSAWPDMPRQETLDNMATIEALLRSARAGQPTEVTL